MTTRNNAASVALAMIALAAGDARAASCSLSVDDMYFGAYRPLGGQHTEAAAAITVDCIASGANTEAVSYSISLSGGNSNNPFNRQLRRAEGGMPLEYNIYLDASYTRVWSGAETPGGSLDGLLTPPLRSSQRHRVYGRIPGGQSQILPGQYLDQLLVIVDY